jgi:hypothetical protein
MVAGALGRMDVTTARTLFPLLILALFTVAAAAPWEMQMWQARVHDLDSDDGGAIEINWDPVAAANLFEGYEVWRAMEAGGLYVLVGAVPSDDLDFVDETTQDGVDYFYKVVALDTVFTVVQVDTVIQTDTVHLVDTLYQVDTLYSAIAGPVHSEPQWFNWSRLNQFLIGGILSTAIIFFIAAARSGRKLYIRKIAGLQAMEEAIGRATEMGRPILFVPGIHDMDDVQTIAGLTILARVAKTVAEYETTLNVPVARSLVMTTARESIKEAYMAAGRPDSYSDDFVHYVTDEQFAYVGAVDGIMVRQKPATCLYMGAFYAESLILSETGAEIGAIQIAGTAQPAQLPFFIAACDYTLIGEELFAASAYLSEEPKQMGSLKGQDVGKVMAMFALGAGSILATLVSIFPDTPSLAQAFELVGRIFQVK